MVALPDLANFDTLKDLLSVQSNDIYQCPSVQTTIMSHWDGWAKRYFLIQAAIYVVWLFGLFWLSEIGRNHRLYSIMSTSTTTTSSQSSSSEYDDNGNGQHAWYHSDSMNYSMLVLVSRQI